ncbi:MAG: hypothetical protein LUI13_13550 [Lachnospiraceae bacterium]|nr:hypothetical protein [Lachnospiraceae bacterium]
MRKALIFHQFSYFGQTVCRFYKLHGQAVKQTFLTGDTKCFRISGTGTK